LGGACQNYGGEGVGGGAITSFYCSAAQGGAEAPLSTPLDTLLRGIQQTWTSGGTRAVEAMAVMSGVQCDEELE
jgi:hypothetical protein